MKWFRSQIESEISDFYIPCSVWGSVGIVADTSRERNRIQKAQWTVFCGTQNSKQSFDLFEIILGGHIKNIMYSGIIPLIWENVCK